MTSRTLITVAAAGSAALLLGALAFQHLGGLAPCKLCLWQRWPHGAAIILGLLALVVGPRLLIAAGGLVAALITAGVGTYHVGVEQKWWEGPQGCTGLDITGLSPADLLNAINAAPIVRCDEIAWSLAGVSMAGWNAIASLIFAVIWVLSLRQILSDSH